MDTKTSSDRHIAACIKCCLDASRIVHRLQPRNLCVLLLQVPDDSDEKLLSELAANENVLELCISEATFSVGDRGAAWLLQHHHAAALAVYWHSLTVHPY